MQKIIDPANSSNPAASFRTKATLRRDARTGLPPSDGQRREELSRLLPLWPREIADLSLAGRRHIVRTLERALRAERQRGKAGHWAYDLSRHAALLASWRLESAALRQLETVGAANARKAPATPGLSD